MKQTLWDDTIVALATPPGKGAIGVIRLSGSKAIAIADKIFRGKSLASQPSHTLHYGTIRDGNRVLDEVVVSLFKTPGSYTGEDVVEISCHGSMYILSRVLELCIAAGARQAHAGEFTMRAFLNGKLDLAQAEAVADVIDAETKAAQHAAMNQLRGGYSGHLAELRERLLQFAALIELELDFAEEDVEFANRKAMRNLVKELHQYVHKLVESFRLGNAVKQGVQVAIIGKPNAGKSTLLNALLNEERAIVSDIPGTTRDTIEEVLNIKGILFRLIDTAGIRDHTTDAIEQLGMERSRQNAEKADIILYLYSLTDYEDYPDEDDNKEDSDLINMPGWLKPFRSKVIVVRTKFDQWISDMESRGINVIPDFSQNMVSAKTGFGMDQLKNKLFERATMGSSVYQSNLVTNARHVEALNQILNSLAEIQTGLKNRLTGDLLSPEIRNCLYHLGTITGQVEVDRDILGTIFGKFCIGK